MPYLNINEVNRPRIRLSINDYRAWEQHPFTKLLQEILEYEYFLKSTIRADSLALSDPNQMALSSAEFKGQLKSLRLFIGRHLDLEEGPGELELKELLDEYIEWDDVPIIENEEEDDRRSIGRRTRRMAD